MNFHNWGGGSSKSIFEFLTLGGVFLGVNNNSKNFLFFRIFGACGHVMTEELSWIS